VVRILVSFAAFAHLPVNLFWYSAVENLSTTQIRFCGLCIANLKNFVFPRRISLLFSFGSLGFSPCSFVVRILVSFAAFASFAVNRFFGCGSATLRFLWLTLPIDFSVSPWWILLFVGGPGYAVASSAVQEYPWP
jgi:hypothetical protein